MRIFGSNEPQTESTFPFLYIIIFVTKSQWRHRAGCIFVYGQVSTPSFLYTLIVNIRVSISLNRISGLRTSR